MKTCALLRKEVAAEPYRTSNAFVDLIATERYENLTAEQRPAHLAFWYDAEVQNGRHFQYYEDRGVEHLHEASCSVPPATSTCRGRSGRLGNRGRGPSASATEFVERSLPGRKVR